MKIEVAVPSGASTKERGDLLEKLSSKLLAAQSFEVVNEIRFTAVELDLLCTHKVSGKEIYVECKAHRNNIDAGVLKSLAGTMLFKGYEEAWLISTAEFGKEAKGFVREWQEKPKSQSSKLSFYTPELVIQALIHSGTIQHPPQEKAMEFAGSENLLGEWTLSITPYGDFWLATKLAGGIPVEVMAFYAKNNEPVVDAELLKKLKATDTTLSEMKFVLARKGSAVGEKLEPEQLVDVVQIQCGDSWSDYRPSRPQDFVGRVKDQNSIFEFFKAIVSRETQTRIFAFTGDSGMGKSSLIAKIADRAKNSHNRKKYFVFPVDVRAATSPSYVYSALLRCLRAAQTAGFGSMEIEINVTDASSPLNSVSVRDFLLSVEKQGQLIVLILDQFEELYSKPELYDVFDRAKSLLLATAAFNGNFCLGFAWKSDSTTHNEHPAYFFWHQLADYRLTRKLSPFSDQDSASVINIFEKEIGQKLHNDLRHNLLVSSQGYPWLLKKLCIHLYEKIEQGVDQADLLENKLDVASLFDGDLNQLSPSERACLDFVAQRAPVDWFEVIEMSSAEALNSLINRRLVIKSGDRLNVYWDIFREYILTGKVPIIPLRYLPYTEFSSVYTVVKTLSNAVPASVQEIAKRTGFSEGTVQNIGTDINVFGIAVRDEGGYLLAPDLDTDDALSVLRRMRDKFKKHAFTIALQDRPSNSVISVVEAVNCLKEIFPNNAYAENTWRTYTVRLCRWMELCGLLISTNNGWVYRDKGDVIPSRASNRKASNTFTAPASPATTLDALNWLIKKNNVPKGGGYPKGYRSALAILARFKLVESDANGYRPNPKKKGKYSSLAEAIWTEAGLEPALVDVLKVLEVNGNLSGKDIGFYLNEKFELNWTGATQLRNGRALKQWALWLLEGKRTSTIPPCPGRI